MKTKIGKKKLIFVFLAIVILSSFALVYAKKTKKKRKRKRKCKHKLKTAKSSHRVESIYQDIFQHPTVGLNHSQIENLTATEVYNCEAGIKGTQNEEWCKKWKNYTKIWKMKNITFERVNNSLANSTLVRINFTINRSLAGGHWPKKVVRVGTE